MKIGSNIIHIDTTVSTNNYAATILNAERIEEGTVISTGFQTGGRGQAGNIWESEKDKNLLFSIVLYPEKIPPADQFMISKAVSLGIAGFLLRHLSDIRIKWPNDIYAGGGKIAGILIENSIAGSRMVQSIAGAGININQTTFKSDAPNPVSMKLITGTEYDTSALMTEILDSIDGFYRKLSANCRQSLNDDYHNLLYQRGEWQLYRARGVEFTGMITGTDSSGCLLVKEASGSETAYMFKEIEYLQQRRSSH
jgi:BirA family biotin operon repressor/biotin-[acetyl-CoA-carboxylase] ligase